MKQLFDHQLVNSFMQYINYNILSKGTAFSNISTGFYPSTGLNQQVTIFASPFKSFLYDKGISGANIINGISGSDGNFYTRASGLSIDFNNGRVLFNSNPNLTICSGTFALNEMNLVYTNANEDRILMDTKYVKNPIQYQSPTGIKENVETFPITYVTYSPGTNKGANLGGLDSTEATFTCYIIADSSYLLDGTMSILRDLNKTLFGLLDPSDMPINVSGDLKDINYNYTGVTANKIWPNVVHLNEVSCSRLTPESNYQINPDVHVGIVECKVLAYRYPRQ